MVSKHKKEANISTELGRSRQWHYGHKRQWHYGHKRQRHWTRPLQLESTLRLPAFPSGLEVIAHRPGRTDPQEFIDADPPGEAKVIVLPSPKKTSPHTSSAYSTRTALASICARSRPTTSRDGASHQSEERLPRRPPAQQIHSLGKRISHIKCAPKPGSYTGNSSGPAYDNQVSTQRLK